MTAIVRDSIGRRGAADARCGNKSTEESSRLLYYSQSMIDVVVAVSMLRAFDVFKASHRRRGATDVKKQLADGATAECGR